MAVGGESVTILTLDEASKSRVASKGHQGHRDQGDDYGCVGHFVPFGQRRIVDGAVQQKRIVMAHKGCKEKKIKSLTHGLLTKPAGNHLLPVKMFLTYQMS